MRNYFCGWYFRCQSNNQTFAIIPSIHKTKGYQFCTIQFITDSQAFQSHFPYSDFQKGDNQITIAGNRFGKDGISINIETPELQVLGKVRFCEFTPLRYDIMGPFSYVPFMQCRHSVYSIHHRVDGKISINGTAFVFDNAIGYIEGDRGYSFPRQYVWTQCSFPAGALMLSIADIPFGLFHFTGIIGTIFLNGKEYRLATYLGARVISLAPDHIIVRQSRYSLTINPRAPVGYPLQAPVDGAMSRTIHEHPSCNVYYRFEDDGRTLLEMDASNAALEYEY